MDSATQREAWAGKPPGGIGLALIFLVLFASRQKGRSPAVRDVRCSPFARSNGLTREHNQHSRLCCLAERTADYFWVEVAKKGGLQIPEQQDYAVVQEVNDRRTCQLTLLLAFRWRHQPYKSRAPRPASIRAEVQRKNSRKGWAVCHRRTASATHKAASNHTVHTYSSGYRLKGRNMVNGYWLIASVADGAADRVPRRCWR